MISPSTVTYYTLAKKCLSFDLQNIRTPSHFRKLLKRFSVQWKQLQGTVEKSLYEYIQVCLQLFRSDIKIPPEFLVKVPSKNSI